MITFNVSIDTSSTFFPLNSLQLKILYITYRTIFALDLAQEMEHASPQTNAHQRVSTFFSKIPNEGSSVPETNQPTKTIEVNCFLIYSFNFTICDIQKSLKKRYE